MPNAITTLSPNVRRFVVFSAAIVVVLVAIALIRQQKSVTVVK